jgi:hypothetical protein
MFINGKRLRFYRLAENQDRLEEFVLKTIDDKYIAAHGKIVFTIIEGTCHYLNYGYSLGQKKFEVYTRMPGETEAEAAERLRKGIVILNSGIIKTAVPISSIDAVIVQ